ncbi:hypothetical protein FJZ26_01110 [Candidatus Parvarchaeota archaeon]|nr:hypothetical protein [Candidatus Parvarchaeota archaeon]
MPEKKNHKELPFNMFVKMVTGAFIFSALFLVLKLLFVSFGTSADSAATLGAAAVTLGCLLSCECVV